MVLHQNSRGPAVKAAQVALQQYDQSLPVNGHFDQRMMRSLKSFEKLKHLPAYGYIADQVWNRLTDSLPD